jgi:hypothetical protein
MLLPPEPRGCDSAAVAPTAHFSAAPDHTRAPAPMTAPVAATPAPAASAGGGLTLLQRIQGILAGAPDAAAVVGPSTELAPRYAPVPATTTTVKHRSASNGDEDVYDLHPATEAARVPTSGHSSAPGSKPASAASAASAPAPAPGAMAERSPAENPLWRAAVTYEHALSSARNRAGAGAAAALSGLNGSFVGAGSNAGVLDVSGVAGEWSVHTSAHREHAQQQLQPQVQVQSEYLQRLLARLRTQPAAQ